MHAKTMTLDPFLLKAPSGSTVAERVFAPLTAAGVEITVVDVGARNGMVLPDR